MDIRDYINKEKDTYGKAFVDISYAIDNISPFMEKKDLNKRKYAVQLKVLDTYMDMLEDAESEAGRKKGFFSMFKGDDSLSKLQKYKADNIEVLNQMVSCSKCKCLNCLAECGFNPCINCRRNSEIVSCDHERYNVTFYHDYTLDLTNNDTGKRSRYKTLATVHDCKTDKKYILIQNLIDENDKFILYLYQKISGDEYGEITDEEEFNTIASLYESVEI